MRNRKSIRIGFLLLFPLLIGQMLLSFYGREPYPAIMMPRFGAQAVQSGQYDYVRYQFELRDAQGDKRMLDHHAFFPDMHLPQRQRAVRRVFAPEVTALRDADFVKWLAGHLARIQPHDPAWKAVTVIRQQVRVDMRVRPVRKTVLDTESYALDLP